MNSCLKPLTRSALTWYLDSRIYQYDWLHAPKVQVIETKGSVAILLLKAAITYVTIGFPKKWTLIKTMGIVWPLDSVEKTVSFDQRTSPNWNWYNSPKRASERPSVQNTFRLGCLESECSFRSQFPVVAKSVEPRFLDREIHPTLHASCWHSSFTLLPLVGVEKDLLPVVS